MKKQLSFSTFKNLLSGNINESTIYYLIDFFCIFAHITYMVVFYIIKIPELFIFNIVSVLFYSAVSLLIGKKIYRGIVIATAVEICIHSATATLMAGWECGFSLLLIILVPLMFFCKFKNDSTAYICSGLIILTFFFLRVYSFYEESSNAMMQYEGVATGLYLLNSFFCFGALTLFSIMYSKTNNYAKLQLIKENTELKTVVNFDPLTGLLNRRSMIKVLQENEDKRSDGLYSFALLLADIDDFKCINDEYGHDCGDYVLRTLAKILNNNVKGKDAICRWGGEEILILIADADKDKAVLVGETIRHAVENYDFEYNDYHFRITLTLGVSSEKLPVHEMVLQSDQHLYFGKKHGKNMVVCN